MDIGLRPTGEWKRERRASDRTPCTAEHLRLLIVCAQAKGSNGGTPGASVPIGKSKGTPDAVATNAHQSTGVVKLAGRDNTPFRTSTVLRLLNAIPMLVVLAPVFVKVPALTKVGAGPPSS